MLIYIISPKRKKATQQNPNIRKQNRVSISNIQVGYEHSIWYGCSQRIREIKTKITDFHTYISIAPNRHIGVF